MRRSTRLFEIIQLLRSADGPLTAAAMARTLEVTKRTVYRDIAALQAMRVPIAGAAGIGYVMRPGYDLPPMMFTADEIEAIVIGLALIARTGDRGLETAAASVARKVSSVIPSDENRSITDWPLYASRWTAVPEPAIDLAMIRTAIRDETRLVLAYTDGDGERTERTVLPLALAYFTESVVLAAWCELRSDFRHFRADRILDCRTDGTRFEGRGAALRAAWQETQHIL